MKMTNRHVTIWTILVVLLTTGIGFADLTDGLVAYYKLDATSGAVVDETGNNDGVNYGATRGVAGKVGSAFEFGGNDYVALG